MGIILIGIFCIFMNANEKFRPFLETRADFYQISMKGYVGFYKDQQDEFKHSNCIHMDVFK